MWQRTDNCTSSQRAASNSSTSLNVYEPRWYSSLEKNLQNLGEEVGKLVLTREGLEKKVKYWLQRSLQTLSPGTLILLPSEIWIFLQKNWILIQTTIWNQNCIYMGRQNTVIQKWVFSQIQYSCEII